MPISKKHDLTPLILTACMCALWLLLHALIGGGFFGSSMYNTYTRQALAWRQGLLHLPEDVPVLELAVYEGEYYVSFPPLPSVILWPLTFVFGMSTPDNLLVKLYAMGACLLMYRSLRRVGYRCLSAGLFAFFFCFASSLLPMTLNGAVWYHAQTLGFFLATAAVCLLSVDRPAWMLLCYALSVACRPFNALYALPLYFTYISLHIRSRQPLKAAARSLAPGTALGLCVALGLGLYNFIRFGNPLEFGHNYLPEFSFQGGIQFSFAHVANHLKTFLWGLPLEYANGALAFKQFGYSMLLACPTLLLMLVWAGKDIIFRTMRREKAVVVLTCALHAFFLLFHRTFGGYQLGARYAVDLIPYTFLYLLLTPEKKKLHWAEAVFLGGILIFTVIGVTQVHIPA